MGEAAKKIILPKPFIKWAGGKRSLIEELLNNIPKNFNNYFEPFIGGGALYFKLLKEGSYLSDINPELINVYRVIRDDVEGLILDLKKHVYDKGYYYQIRGLDRNDEYISLSNLKKASRLVYLNRVGFNGLYRVNKKGEFNVPFGRYKNPLICDEDNLRACSKVLKTAKISCGSFSKIINFVSRNDFVYLDPPYIPLSKTSKFTSYSKEKFDDSMQEELKNLCAELNKRGVKFLLSNSYSESSLSLYKEFNVSRVFAPRNINAKSSSRGAIPEILVKNY